MADQLENLVATAEAMIASQGVPRTPANIQRAVQMLAANPDLPRTQVARQTGLTRAPDALYLGDGLDASHVNVPVPAQQMSAQQGVPSSKQAVQQQEATQQQQQQQQQQQDTPDDIVEGDEFEPIDPTTGVPPIVLPAAAAAAASSSAVDDLQANNADALGMNIEGGQRAIGMDKRLALPAPSGPASVSGPNLDNPLLPPPEPTVIRMPNESGGPTIIPQPTFEQSMDARGTDVLDASPQMQIYRSKRTGKMYQVNKVTGEVLDNLGKPLSGNAAQALLRTLRRM